MHVALARPPVKNMKHLVYLPFHEALAMARSFQLRTKTEWELWGTSTAWPPNIPMHPDAVYAHCGWRGWAHWLAADATGDTDHDTAEHDGDDAGHADADHDTSSTSNPSVNTRVGSGSGEGGGHAGSHISSDATHAPGAPRHRVRSAGDAPTGPSKHKRTGSAPQLITQVRDCCLLRAR